MRTLAPRLATVTFLALAAAPSAWSAPAHTVVINDTFDNRIPSGTDALPGFWIPQSTGGDRAITEHDGKLTLNAQANDYAFASLLTRLDPQLNFFNRSVTVSIEDFAQELSLVPPADAFFRLSLNSSEQRQNTAPHSLTLRIAPGIAVLGFKTPASAKADAEYCQGPRTGAAWTANYTGTLTGLTLTVDPVANPGALTCIVVLKLSGGPQPFLVGNALLPLRPQDWTPSGDSALVLETRRNLTARDEVSYVRTSLGRVVVSHYR